MGTARSPSPAKKRTARAQGGGARGSAHPTACLWRQPLHVPQQVAKLPSMELALDPRRGPHPHPPQLDEPCRGRLVELIALAIGGKRELVQLVRTLPPDHLRRPFEQLDPHVAGHMA